jgi:membrane-bound ClpP family serine protease
MRMLSRWFNLFIGMVLTLMGIVGYLAPNFLTGDLLGFGVPTMWLLTGLIALGVGFFVRNLATLRWVAGLIGVVYLIWGLIGLFAETTGLTTNPLSFFVFLLGALGLSAALAPATWMRETTDYDYNEART